MNARRGAEPVCRCGAVMERFADGKKPTECTRCRRYRMRVARGVDPLDAALEPPLNGRCEICAGDGGKRDG